MAQAAGQPGGPATQQNPAPGPTGRQFRDDRWSRALRPNCSARRAATCWATCRRAANVPGQLRREPRVAGARARCSATLPAASTRRVRLDGVTQFEPRPRHPEGVRLGGRHLQRQRACRSTAATSAPTIWARCRPRAASRPTRADAAVGAVVPAGVPRRPGRRKDRPAEPRPGIHGQPGLEPVPQHHDGLADGAVGRSVCRRPGLSAVLARRARCAVQPIEQPSPCWPACSRTIRPAARSTTTASCAASTQSGGNFNLRTGALLIAEVQYAVNQPAHGQMDTAGREPRACPAPTSWAPGSTPRASPTSATTTPGCRWPIPNSTGIAEACAGTITASTRVVDQTVWQPDPDEPQAVGVFARVMGAPGDRNLIDFSVNAGVTLKAPLPGRDDDTFGIGYRHRQGQRRRARPGPGHRALHRRLSAGARQRDVPRSHLPGPDRAVVAVQPDFQYFFTPGGGVANPNSRRKRIGNAAVFGVRTNVTF